MSKVDILRFVDKVRELFAPSIHDGQAFFAYLDEDTNIFTVQGDNLFSSAGQEDIERISVKLAALATQIDGVEDDCSDIPSMKTQIASLQSDVEALSQGSSEDSSAGASIAVVDDIIYGAYDYTDSSSLVTPNLKALRGRPCLETNYGGLWVDNFLTSGNFGGIGYQTQTDRSGYRVYAGFGDGKIHMYNYDNDTLSSVPLNNGDFIFNKADNALYLYDATNHKFIKASGKHHYSVDMIIDYVGQSLPAAFNSEGVRFVELYQEYSPPRYHYMGLHNNNFTDIMHIDPQGGFCFASIQSNLTDDAAIFEVVDSAEGVIVTHDLYDGDTVFNKNDGCTYLFSDNGSSKSFSVTSINPIEPVLDIVPIWDIPPYPSAVGDKAIDFSTGDYNPVAYLNSSSDGEYWDNSTQVENNARYASSSNHKIYTFDSDNGMQISDVPVGASFLNKADNSLYVYDGSQFIKT